MTRQLLPQFIQHQFAAHRTQGSLHAYTLFADISGFTAMTESLMQRGNEGAELLSVLLNQIFEPMVQAVYQYGGFIPYFAGDAFTAIFEVESTNPNDFLHVAQYIQQLFMYHFKNQDFEIDIKIGLSCGNIEWGIVGQDHKGFYFRGEGIDGCANAQMQAERGQIVLDEALRAQLTDTVLSVSEHKKGFYFLNKNTKRLTLSTKKHDYLDTRFGEYFLPQSVLDYNQKGEFRNVVSVFISFEGIATHDELNAFSSIVLQQMASFSGYFKEIDFGDKGGVLVGFFGAPVSFENNQARALEFAWSLRLELASCQVKYKIGMTSGIAYTGIIGGLERCQYACVGTHVNLAARLMAKAHWGHILVDDGMSKNKLFRFKNEGQLSYKGFEKPIATHQLLGHRLDETPGETGIMVGRDRELAELLSFAEPLLDARFAGIATLYGEAGIGKSKLSFEFRKALAEQGIDNWLVSQSDQILRKPFNPFIYCLKFYFDQSPELSVAENQTNFEQNFQQILSNCLNSNHARASNIARELSRTRSILLALIGIVTPDSLWEQLDAKGRYDNTKVAISTLFIAESLTEALVIELEDAHWYDDSSKDFLNDFLKQIVDYQILILVTSRYQDDGTKLNFIQIPEHCATLELDLNMLNLEGIKHLAEVRLGGPIDDDFTDFLQRSTSGNPFYAAQMLEYFSESKLIESKNNAWSLKDKNLKLSNSINTVLIARVDRLSGLVKETVKAAAVIGREFEVPILTEVMRTQEDFIRKNGNMPNVLREQIQEAERSQIWRAMNELRYIFKHSLLREAVYDMQLNTRLRDLHRLIAEAIEALYVESIEERFADLAFHFEQAAIAEKTKEYLQKAGDYAKRNFQNQAALTYYSKLLTDFEYENDATEHIKITLKTGDIHQLIGEWTNAETAFSDALKKANVLNDKQLLARANNSLGTLLMLKGEYNIAEKHFEVALALFDYLKDQFGISKAFGNLGNLFFRQGKYEQAKTYFTQCIALASTLGEDAVNAQIVANLGLTHMNQGNFDEAIACQLDHLPLVEQRKDKQGIATLHTNLGIVYSEKGDLENALPHYEQGLAQSRELGNKLLMAIGIGSIGSVYERLGDYTKAREMYEEDLQLTEALGDKQGIAIAHGLMGGLNSLMGKFEEAEYHLKLNLSLCESLNYQKGIIKAVNTLGDVYTAMEQYELAAVNYDRAIAVSRSISNKQLLCESLAERAEVCLKLNDIEQAKTLNTEAMNISKSLIINALELETELTSVRILRYENSIKEGLALLNTITYDHDNPREQAAFAYEYFSLTHDKTYQQIALELYRKLYATTPKYLYKKRIELLGK